MTIKIAHIADTHLGYRQYGLTEREKDFYDIFKKIVDDIIEKDVDYVIHCGDLFEQPKPPIDALLTAQECFNKLFEHDIPVYVIGGNHDILQRRETSLPQELYTNDKFHIFTTKDNYTILNDEIFLSGLPYISKNNEKAVKQLLEELVEKSKGYKHKIVMLHGSVSEFFEFNPEFELETIPEGFDYYAMGHLHKRIMTEFRNGILSYPGSTEINNAGEISDYHKSRKGYNIITIENDKLNPEYIDIELERKTIRKNIKYPELDNELEKLENKINNEILTKTDKKPILILNIVEGDFERSEVAKRIYDKLGEISLSIRLTYAPTELIDESIGGIDDDITAEYLLDEKLEKYGKDVQVLGLELYKNLSIKNISEAKKISDRFYEEVYHNQDEGEDNDNQ